MSDFDTELEKAMAADENQVLAPERKVDKRKFNAKNFKGGNPNGAPSAKERTEKLKAKFPHNQPVAKSIDVYETAMNIVNEQMSRLSATSSRQALDYGDAKKMVELLKIHLLLENKEAPGSNKEDTMEKIQAAMKLLNEKTSQVSEEEEEYPELSKEKF